MFARPFRIPNLANETRYDPGPQLNIPGESDYYWAGFQGLRFSAQPWPYTVPVLRALASDPGTARMRGVLPVVNRYSPNPQNYLFIADIVGKSKG